MKRKQMIALTALTLGCAALFAGGVMVWPLVSARWGEEPEAQARAGIEGHMNTQVRQTVEQSEEESAASRKGEASPEESGKPAGQEEALYAPDSAGEEPEAPSGEAPSEMPEVPAEEPVEEGPEERLIEQLYALRDTFTGRLDGIVKECEREYRGLDPSRQTRKSWEEIYSSRIDEISALEKECDSRVAEIVAQLKELDPELAAEAQREYRREKNDKIASLMA